MSKARARERKKKRLAQAHAAKGMPETHETGEDATPAAVAEQNQNGRKFDTQQNKGVNAGGGKNIPNLAASSRGASRSS